MEKSDETIKSNVVIFFVKKSYLSKDCISNAKMT